MNDGNEGNNSSPDGKQNNIIAQALTRDALVIKYTTIAMKNKWQIEYKNIC